jgi:hypothetical protein
MSQKDRHNGHQTETPDVSHIRNVEVTHEKSDINVRAVLVFVVVLTVATIAVCVGMWLLFAYFDRQEAKTPRPGPMALTEKKDRLPPEPRLQAAPGFAVELKNGEQINLEKSAPQSEYWILKKQWEENLQTGLKDQSGNVVGLPIDKAIEKVARDGLPTRMRGPAVKLEDFAIGMPTAASSGRETEKKLQ